MNDEKLIELVRGYPVLYDMCNSKYMDSDFKNSVWRKVGAKMKLEGSASKTRWSNIRDNFRKSLNKQKTKSGQKATKVKPYKYSEQLSFWKKFFEERETTTNIESEVNIEDFTGETESEEAYEIYQNTEAQDSTASEVNDAMTTQSESQNSLKLTPRDTIPQKTRKLSATNPTAVPKTAAATVMEYIVERNKTMNYPAPTHQPVDAFLAGIAPALKKLSLHDWHYAKGEIFATVQKFELNMLNRQQFAASSNVMCSTGQPSPAESYQSSWDQSTLSPDQTRENAAPNLSLAEYYQTFP